MSESIAESIAEMIAEATVDCYDESEQTTGWFTVFEEYLELPFETRMLGISVTVVTIEVAVHGQIVAICKRGRDRQPVLVCDLPLPSPKPAGSQWIEAYRCWLAGRS